MRSSFRHELTQVIRASYCCYDAITRRPVRFACRYPVSQSWSNTDVPPGAVGPSAVPCSNVPPDRLVSAHRPIQLSSISVCSSPADVDDQHPIEGFVGLIRERSIVSTHSGELLVSTIQDVNGDIGFEHQPGWYRTNWIGGCLRLVLSEAGARKLYGVSQCMPIPKGHVIMKLTLV
ncbi:hypothetical protein N658DRAFT_435087 [Parathielavia hyrcaniae]|uniref:Uncharacterized protein n=1 Tax=Parathielavia hyrcaniae TaxID=113614 RepID=A0AAN6PS48_9PEZI|nr:hypothetical protein N658DRAFT_435087 [Parathielavia hyrcaniae]